MMRDYDEETTFLGQTGPYFWATFFLLNTVYVSTGFNGLYIVFAGAAPKHHCLVPDVNLTDEWRDAVIPVTEENGKAVQSQCWRYKLDVVRNLSAEGYVPGRDVNLTALEQERCLDGWTYSQEIYKSTIVTEWDLVCDDQWKVPFTSSTLFVGYLLGSLISGQLSDRFGRKKVVFISLAAQALAVLLQSFSYSWKMFCVTFLFVGASQISIYISAFVLGTELLSKTMRVIFTTLGAFLFYCAGYMTLPWIAYAIRDWRTLLAVLSSTSVVYLPLWWFIPESPRWLITQGRTEEAEAIVRDAARKNKVEAPAVIFKRNDEQDTPSTRKYSMLDILKFRNIRCITLMCLLLWMAINIGYFGLSLNTSNLSGDPYMNCFLSATTEVPAYVVSTVLLKKCPRRALLSTFLALGGGVLLLVQFISDALQWVALALVLAGKFGFTMAFSIVYIYTAEIYPTVLRNVGMGMCSSAARIGSITAPYVIYLGTSPSPLPYMLMGSLTVASSVVNLFLPETLNRDLPETVEQMQECRGLCTGPKKRKYMDNGSIKPSLQHQTRAKESKGHIKMDSTKVRDYDSIVSFLGSWGPFQRQIFFSLALSIIPNGFLGAFIVFVAASPPHECLIPDSYNLSQAWTDAAIPLETVDGKVQRSSCFRLSMDVVRNYSDGGVRPNEGVNVSEIPLESCVDGWKYSKDIFQSTIVTDWDLVCDNAYKVPLTTSIHYVGVLLGGLLSGHLSDRYGRKYALFLMMALQTLATTAQIFSPNWIAFTVLFSIAGAGAVSNYVIAFVLGTEILNAKARVFFCSLGVFMSSAIGYMLLAPMAMALREWYLLMIPMAASGLIYIPIWWLVPESPRWLFSQGRVKEAETILMYAAKKNGIDAPETIFSQDEIDGVLQANEKKHNLFVVLRDCNVFIILLLCSLLWVIITIGYFALILNTSNLHGDPYLNAFLSAVAEVPAYLIALTLLRFFSRRLCQSSTLFIGGVMILCVHLLPIDLPWVGVLLEMLGKFGITAAFCIVYTVSSELFPTVIRNSAMGCCAMAGRLGTIISPFIIYIGQFNQALPYILMGALALLGAFLCLLLPETHRKPLPEVLADMQKLFCRTADDTYYFVVYNDIAYAVYGGQQVYLLSTRVQASLDLPLLPQFLPIQGSVRWSASSCWGKRKPADVWTCSTCGRLDSRGSGDTASAHERLQVTDQV
ncbi:uncharacterized protein ACB057_013132 [Neosynchiropus ocellatus]